MGSWLILLALSAAPQGAEPQAHAADQEFLVIVNVGHEGAAIQRGEVANIFLRKAVRWGDGRAIDPADQSLSSDVRATFSRRVLLLEPRAVLQYWQSQLQRGGARPPAVKKSDADVVEWVGKALGRIGYVKADAQLSEDVKAVSILE
jgi:ABC-type phosphate transport system substrate-binding protein